MTIIKHPQKQQDKTYATSTTTTIRLRDLEILRRVASPFLSCCATQATDYLKFEVWGLDYFTLNWIHSVNINQNKYESTLEPLE
mmetsp:Transcript_28185/g.39865  ORF Transcript_28185/g.39865 Transcript_28185/m.39865 type:complete len:84 (+) Transcript_28185:596-847(+)